MDVKTDFIELVRKVKDNTYLLPDFQRGFVWTDESQQKSIVSSVLSKMPIGNILLLEANSSDYACKYIGSKKRIDPSAVKQKVSFILDGQQRITVLTNVFSNVIHNNTSFVSDLTSASLKRRFFLRIPKWTSIYINSTDENDLFGIKYLLFPYANPDTAIPDFLSGEVERYIEYLSFKADDGKPYNPKTPLSTDLDMFCFNNSNGYLIPLFLMIPSGSNNSQISHAKLRYSQIITGVGEQITKDIQDYYAGLPTESAKHAFCDDFFKEEADIDLIKKNQDLFDNRLKERAKVWHGDLDKYLNSCLKEMILNEVVVSEQERKRAIDIYENMNRGGVSLNTFDLIMARVAIANSDPFMDRIYGYIDSNKSYPTAVIHNQTTKAAVELLIQNNKYNASQFAKCYSGIDKQLASSYIDGFLDILSLYCNNMSYVTDIYKVDLIKKNEILKLEPEAIDKNAKKICNSIDRALFFFETRCGIRSIKEINYSLMLVIVGTIFTNDSWYNDKKVHDLLEAWYWAAVFSGEFDKDQNTVMIRNLSSLIKTITGVTDKSWIMSMKDEVMNANNFSDKKLLLMKKSSEERLPKTLLRGLVCQYLLSETYPDMFVDNRIITVFNTEADSLEAHHIIPLGTAATYGSSTKSLRSKTDHILNSPINFILITKEANNQISDDDPSIYFSKITLGAKSKLHLTGFSASSDPEAFLNTRFDNLNGDIRTEIISLLGLCIFI